MRMAREAFLGRSSQAKTHRKLSDQLASQFPGPADSSPSRPVHGDLLNEPSTSCVAARHAGPRVTCDKSHLTHPVICHRFRLSAPFC